MTQNIRGFVPEFFYISLRSYFNPLFEGFQPIVTLTMRILPFINKGRSYSPGNNIFSVPYSCQLTPYMSIAPPATIIMLPSPMMREKDAGGTRIVVRGFGGGVGFRVGFRTLSRIEGLRSPRPLLSTPPHMHTYAPPPHAAGPSPSRCPPHAFA